MVFFRKRKIIAEARVFKVRANGLVVFVPKFGIEGPVLFDGDAGATTLDEDAMTVSHRGKSYKVFDRLTVQVEVEQLPAHRSRLLINVVPDDTPLGEVKLSGESSVTSAVNREN